VAVAPPAPPAAPPPNPGPPPTTGLFTGIESALRWATAYPLFLLQFLLIALIAFGGLGAELGAEHLFWHERWWYQVGVGFFVGLLFAVNLMLLFLMNRPTLLTGWLDRRAPSLLPSRDPVVRSLGRFLLCGLLAALALFYGVKGYALYRVQPEEADFGEVAAPDAAPPEKAAKAEAAQQAADTHAASTGRAGYLKSRSHLWPFGVGYLLSMTVGLLLFGLDEGWFRRRAGGPAPVPWRDQLLGWRELGRRLTARGVPAADHPVHAILLIVAVLAVAVAVLYVVYSGVVDYVEPGSAITTPLPLVCVLLILLSLFYGVVEFFLHMQRLILGGAVLALVCWNSTCLFRESNYKFRFPGMTYDRDHRTVLYLKGTDKKSDPDRYTNVVLPASRKYAAENLVPADAPLKAMLTRWRGGPGRTDQKPKLIFVATSGGGIRAAVWTAVVLEGLEADAKLAPAGFRQNIRMITGASGGMVAAALYAADFEHGPQGDKYRKVVARDSLNRTAQSLIIRDFGQNVFLPPWSAADWDRGRTLEWKWGFNAEAELGRNPFAKTMAELRGAERTGARPSLVFSPMLIEDSRRLLVSNLDLEDLTTVLADGTKGKDPPQAAFVSAVEFHRLFPDLPADRVKTPDGKAWGFATSDGFAVATAARMSATFPVISPAVSLPTTPPRRVVDAGYYDNYGINLAARWLYKHRAALAKHTSGVALVEVRAFPLHDVGRRFAATDPQTGQPTDTAGSGDLFTDAAAAVSAPLEALFSARGNVAYYRNREWVDVLQEALKKDGLDFYNGWFELTRPASLNWFLTAVEREAVEAGFHSRANQEQLERLRAWYGTGGQ
jgi:hypothetical protein